jgi:hypothetical protein
MGMGEFEGGGYGWGHCKICGLDRFEAFTVRVVLVKFATVPPLRDPSRLRVNRRSENERRRKPGRCGRDDRFGEGAGDGNYLGRVTGERQNPHP